MIIRLGGLAGILLLWLSGNCLLGQRPVSHWERTRSVMPFSPFDSMSVVNSRRDRRGRNATLRQLLGPLPSGIISADLTFGLQEFPLRGSMRRVAILHVAGPYGFRAYSLLLSSNHRWIVVGRFISNALGLEENGDLGLRVLSVGTENPLTCVSTELAGRGTDVTAREIQIHCIHGEDLRMVFAIDSYYRSLIIGKEEGRIVERHVVIESPQILPGGTSNKDRIALWQFEKITPAARNPSEAAIDPLRGDDVVSVSCRLFDFDRDELLFRETESVRDIGFCVSPDP
jgi:hypothetical protein